MRQLIINGRVINDYSMPYVIAEIGSNHDGDIEKCKKLIREIKFCGCDAVKLQKKNVETLYTKSFANELYMGFGDTYGEHKKALEFSEADFVELSAFADEIGITFFATPFDETSAEFLNSINVPAFKIASAYLRDLPLLERVISFKKPMIISTGGATIKNIIETYRWLKDRDFNDFAFLHCVATYPNRPHEINLRTITLLRTIFRSTVIGWSDHYPGRLPSIIAHAYGARIIEKHFKERGDGKGTDKKFSVDRRKMDELIEDLLLANEMLGLKDKPLESETKAIRKMARSIWPVRTIKKGEILSNENLGLKTPADGLPVSEYENISGKIAVCDLSTSDPIKEGDFE